MNVCICCNSKLLRHLNRYKIYWFCPYCHQEMPDLLRFKSLRSSINAEIKLRLKQVV